MNEYSLLSYDKFKTYQYLNDKFGEEYYFVCNIKISNLK